MGMIQLEPMPQRPSVGQIERWGAVMSGGALALYGLTRRSVRGMGLALLGGGLVYRGLVMDDGHLHEALGMETAKDRVPAMTIQHGHGIKVTRSIMIHRPPEELYSFWRDLQNLPLFMDHLESVRVTEPLRSHWVAKAPAGLTVEWDAEIINDIPNELIGWRSLEGSEVPNAGSVHFEERYRGQGTKVTVVLKYDPPAGPIGDAFAKLFGEAPSQTVRADLRRLKEMIEMSRVEQ